MSIRALTGTALLLLLTACPTEGGPCKETSDCPKGRTCCDGKCLDTENDKNNCGGCGQVCDFPNVVPSCRVGRCQFQCQAGFGNCNDVREDGCEQRTIDSADNCGVCGRVCMSVNAASVCAQSLCGLGACNEGFADCDQEPINGCEIDTRNDAMNCAGCGQVCDLPHTSTQHCAASLCEIDSCDTGWGNCDNLSSNGCEVEFATDALNCGACGRVCGPQQYCAAATCRARELIIFGGQLNFIMGNTTAEVFRFDLVSNTFTQLNPATPDGNIPGRGGHVATFDYPRNRMLVWGGIDGAGTLSPTDTWALDFAVVPPAWRKVTTTGTPPSARFGVAAAQDVANAKWYLFGGSTELGDGLSELYTFDLATNTWSQVHGNNSPGGPINRVNAVAAFDPAAGKFVLFSGNNAIGMDMRELWTFDVTTRMWAQIPDTGVPIPRVKGALFDGSPVHLFSGIASLQSPPASMVTDWWALSVSAATPWTQLTATGPSARFSAASTARDGKLYVFAGGATVGTTQTVFTDLWAADPSGPSWLRLNEGLTNAPTGKLNASMVGR